MLGKWGYQGVPDLFRGGYGPGLASPASRATRLNRKSWKSFKNSAINPTREIAEGLVMADLPAISRSGFSKFRGGLGRVGRAASPGLLIGLGTVALGARAALGVSRMANGFLQGLLPNNVYPMSYGQYGFRTAADAGPAGIQGLKFQFRRK